MSKQTLENALGHDFVEMIETLTTKEVKESYSPQACYENLLDQFDKTITDQLPGINSLFEKLDKDLQMLEKNSNLFDKDLEKLIKEKASSSVTDVPTNIQAKNVVSNLPREVEKRSSEFFNKQHARLIELKANIKQGRIDCSALHVGVPVLGLCKDEWKEGVIEDVLRHNNKLKYKIRFTKTKRKSLLVLHHVACCETPLLFPYGELPLGSRIAATFKDEGIFSGVIAESADYRTNKGRYLVFYDDGYTMYCSPKSVYVVYGPHINVWNDIPQKGTSEFVKNYLSVSERQLLSLKEGQNLKVEFDGEWHRGKCNRVDCSLVEILYFSDGSTEWIYRGSQRLEPLHLQQQTNKMNNKSNKIARAHTGMRRAHIEYVDLTGDSTHLPSTDNARFEKKDDMWVAPWARSRSEQKAHSSHTAPTRIPNSFTELRGGYDVASQIQNRFNQKDQSTSDHKIHYKPSFRSHQKHNNDQIDDGIDVGTSLSNIRKHLQPYSVHSCSFQCIAGFSIVSAKKMIGCNPLIKPLLCGWTREICRVKPSFPRTSFHVLYRAPCGRACRDMADVERYMTKCRVKNLDFDHFCFDHTVRTIIGSPSRSLKVSQPRDAKYFNFDYSMGNEDVPISCVNEINYEEPPKMPYTKARVPGKDVQINTSPDFMICCDCVDDCRDKSKCACQQLTVQATSCSHGGKTKNDAGYEYKRLFSFLPTGIYECNSRCKCSMQCKNRVVQKGLQCRLQMFKTQKKGWGIRCIDDIPQGSFVCVYTGKIETDTNANAEGLKHGDEYLAELDHIEVAENQKDDYSSDNSSGFDSDGHSSDDEESRLRADSTDTDENEDNDVLQRQLGPVTLIGGHKRKLGYAVHSTISSSLSENSQQRKTTTKRNIDKNNKALISFSTNQKDDETTDTDSDSEPAIYRTPTARKSTGTYMHDISFDADSQNSDHPTGTRRFFGSEGTYIIDAKQTGNLGRYINHSCTPNLMVQNVFLDTHDLRFPWVAFFASSFIRSGNELTWDYNYEIGSVPDRVIHCYCGSTKCRKRLL